MKKNLKINSIFVKSKEEQLKYLKKLLQKKYFKLTHSYKIKTDIKMFLMNSTIIKKI